MPHSLRIHSPPSVDTFLFARAIAERAAELVAIDATEGSLCRGAAAVAVAEMVGVGGYSNSCWQAEAGVAALCS